jgi:hypothetical protein
MTPSSRLALAGYGLATALLMSGTAVAAPKLPQKPSSSISPKVQVKPTAIVNLGLTTAVELTPRSLYTGGVSMNLLGPVRVETTTNKVKMDEHTQLWIHFRGAADQAYDLDCRFTGSQDILVMDYAADKFVGQRPSMPCAEGKLHYEIAARPSSENRKVYLQAAGDIEWLSCTVTPG